MTAQRAPVHSGGCQCGAIRYALYAPPERVHLCHCRMCQKAVGGPFAALAPVRLVDFAYVTGAPAEYPSSKRAVRGYCPRCGTPLSFRYVDSDWIDVTIGSLDEPRAVAPELHYGVESYVPWLDHLATLPRHDTELGGLTGDAY